MNADKIKFLKDQRQSACISVFSVRISNADERREPLIDADEEQKKIGMHHNVSMVK